MAVIETWLKQDLQDAVNIHHLDGSLFSNNGNGNRIGVELYNNGEALSSISGSVSGYAVLSDGTTVPCTGTKSGNKASVLVPPAAYIPGNIFITVFITDGSTVTTVAAVQSIVTQARTDSQVDPGSVVTDWTNTINTAMQNVNTAASNLGNIVAVPYASITFPVPLGKYTIYNNNLYRCTTAIASSEAFTSSHWTNVRLGDDVSDLNTAIDEYKKTIGESPLGIFSTTYSPRQGTSVNFITVDHFPVGSTVKYKFHNTANGSGLIDLYDSNNQRIQYIGTAIGQAETVYQGTLTIPNGMSYAIISGTKDVYVEYFYIPTATLDQANANTEIIGYKKLSQYAPIVGMRINGSTGQWATSLTSSYIVIPVSGGEKISLVAGSGLARIAALKTYTPTVGTSADFSTETGWTGVLEIAALSAHNAVIPSDATYLYILAVNSNTSVLPSCVLIDGIDIAKDVRQHIADVNSTVLTPVYKGVISKNTVVMRIADYPNIHGIAYSLETGAAGDKGGMYVCDASDNVIATVGKRNTNILLPTSYAGYIHLPDNWSYIKSFAMSTITINYIYTSDVYMAQNARIGYECDRLENLSRLNADNRLANPLYSTIEEKNITGVELFPLEYLPQTDGSVRIPTVIISNSGTILAACENRDSRGEDYGNSSLVLQRKPSGGDWGTPQIVYPYEPANNIRYTNPCLLIDRDGTNSGVAGRIYFFAGKYPTTALWYNVPTANMDMGYKYSDDDGVTWSAWTSLKSEWDTTKYSGVIPSPDNGIVLTDGTFVVPCMTYIYQSSIYFANCIAYKKVGEDWKFSDITPGWGENESSVIQLDSGEVVVISRNENVSSNRTLGEEHYYYDFDKDSFTRIETSFLRIIACKSSVTKTKISGKTIYLKTFPCVNHTSNLNRRNITVWASTDSLRWIRCINLISDSNRHGYASVYVYNGDIVALYETANGKIMFADLSNLSTLLVNSLSYMDVNVNINDRLQMFYDYIKGELLS